MNIQAPSQSTPTGSSPSGSSNSGGLGMDPLSTRNTFLKLLVAQLKNQDPLSPQDPTQFLSQITQISSVEQLVQMNQSLTAIQTALTQNNGSSAGGSSSSTKSSQ